MYENYILHFVYYCFVLKHNNNIQNDTKHNKNKIKIIIKKKQYTHTFS